MKRPHLMIFHTTSVSKGNFSEFKEIVKNEKLDFQVESREDDGIVAGIEWLMPTAVIVYITKSYFDGFLKEMGKDHYALLKAGFKTLHARLLGPKAPEITLLASNPGKLSGNQTYSLFYSIMAEAGSGLSFKFLLQRKATEAEYEEIISNILEFLHDYHMGDLDAVRSVQLQNHVQSQGHTLLLAFDSQSKSIEVVDPLPKRDKG
jgi:hypothetical protein